MLKLIKKYQYGGRSLFDDLVKGTKLENWL